MRRKGAAINVSLAIFTFIATASIMDISLTSFANVEEMVQAASIELQASRFTTAVYATKILDNDSYVEIKFSDEYTIYSDNFPDGAVQAKQQDNFIRPDLSGDDYQSVIHIGEDGFAPIGAGSPDFVADEKTSEIWCIENSGAFDVEGECG